MMNFCTKLLMMSPLLESFVFKFMSNRRKLFVFFSPIGERHALLKYSHPKRQKGLNTQF